MNVSRDSESDEPSVEVRLRRLRAAAATSRRVPATSPHILWELVLIGAVTVTMFPIWPFAEVATTDYPEAREQADLLQAALEPVWRGERSLEDLTIPDGLRLYSFSAAERTTWVLVHAQPTSDGTCYGVRIGGGLVTEAVLFFPTDGCVPQGRFAFEESGAWEEVLPSPQMTPLWFVPAVGILGGCALAAGASIVMKRLFK